MLQRMAMLAGHDSPCNQPPCAPQAATIVGRGLWSLAERRDKYLDGFFVLFYNRILQRVERSTRHTRYRPLTKVHALGQTDTPQTPTRWHAEAHQPDLPSLSKAPHA